MSNQKLIIICLATINIIAYLLMIIDKTQAIRKAGRIPEKTLFLIAFLFGALGIYCGMKTPIRHKSNKPVFRILIPILIVMNGVGGYFIFKVL